MNLLRKLFSPKKENRSQAPCQMEKCVNCGKQTTVPTDEPIESRPNFISGCGQLCPDCYARLCYSCEDDESSKLISSVLNKHDGQ